MSIEVFGFYPRSFEGVIETNKAPSHFGLIETINLIEATCISKSNSLLGNYPLVLIFR